MFHIHYTVSRQAFVHGPLQVSIKGKTIISPQCHIRGDLAPVRIGRYCFIDTGTIIRPPFVQEAQSLFEYQHASNIHPSASTTSNASISRTSSSTEEEFVDTHTLEHQHHSSTPSSTGTFVTIQIGNHTHIGQDCVIEAAAIGSSVMVGKNTILSKRVIIKDCVYIDENTIVPPDMVIPPCTSMCLCICMYCRSLCIYCHELHI